MKKVLSLLVMALFVAVPSVFAADGADAGALSGAYKSLAAAFGAAFAIGFAAFGGATGQAKAVVAALEGIGRNPGAADKMFVPMIVGLALIESLVIYALLIAFMLLGYI